MSDEFRYTATVVLLAFNQEAFVRDAIASLLRQTGASLEIILSDDCSTDSTFAIMTEMATAYTGPHKLVLNRNEVNLGVCGHLNRAVRTANGEIIILAAGDDISVPERAEVLVSYFTGHPRCNSVYSNAVVIDSNGIAVGTWRPRGWSQPQQSLLEMCQDGVPLLGCSHAFRKSLVEAYGPLDVRIGHEDRAISFRAALEGTVEHIDQLLVHYRRHGANTWTPDGEFASPRALRNHRRKYGPRVVALRQAMRSDFDRYLERFALPPDRFAAEISALERGVRLAEIELEILQGPRLARKLRLVLEAARLSPGIRPLARQIAVEFAPRLFLLRARLRGLRARR